ncbi:MAG: RNA-binding transcriptional accessory protein [Bacteroidetes bacterium]|nr:MAG: RNA-binding transcriptional accessory protein [Bacteroidota bacterium]
MLEKYFEKIAKEISVRAGQVANTAELLKGGATVPFIARYRKEYTDSLDEEAIMHIRDRMEQLEALDKRRESILQSIEEQGKLTDELKKQLEGAESMSELEDIYLPYRPKRKTRATIARSRGLEPLAKMIMSQNPGSVESLAERFVDSEKEVESIDGALAGARDIIAEWVTEHKYARNSMRRLFRRSAMISSKAIKGKEEEGMNYKSWFDYAERIATSPSHRVLAMFRGEKEGFLRLTVEPDKLEALEMLRKIFLKAENESSEQLKLAIEDAYKRLLQPSMDTEMKAEAKERADKKAIEVFIDNAKQLLLAPPLGQKTVLAIDPGFRTGCKVVCLGRQGELLHNETIYPHPPQNEVKDAIKKIQSLVDAYKIEAIAIGNGTAGRQTERFIKSIRFNKDLIAVMVNESGASIYSASKVAREEFPDYDITVRGSVSIGRRLMDPMAELVKIEPKSIGVGQYQHDVNQSALARSLEDTVMSCVNSVGVEVNTASKQLLSYVSGLGPSLAGKIIDHRSEHGPFSSRAEFMKVSGFGDKAFEQAAGFLRIMDAKNPLDSSAVHPESYPVVAKILKSYKVEVDELVKDEKLRKQIDLQAFVTKKTGLPTLVDILDELAKPGRDPRKKFDLFEFEAGVNKMEDLRDGMVLPGIVTNITAFGAFVDIGVHQDGLVHVSQMADRFVKDPNEIVSLNQKVQVRVAGVDLDRKRIQLSMKNIS